MKPHKIYSTDTEPSALEQFYSAMELDCVVRGALMADAHTGYSLPIGGVVATDGMVFPAWVGYDIGCGVCAVQLPGIKREALEPFRKQIFESVYRSVPTGMGGMHKLQVTWDWEALPHTDVVAGIMKKNGLHSLGTLGGGNHFIEIGSDEGGDVWVIIHSGSRGVGHKVASEYMRLASGSAQAKEGHYGFAAGSEHGKEYLADMNFCLEFALENRRRMLLAACNEIWFYLTGEKGFRLQDASVFINRTHNHIDLKDGMYIHRKGATHAEDGMHGVIPGNMRDGCYITIGKGVEEALWSSSHGAGRAMSRQKAQKDITLKDFQATMAAVTAKVDDSTKDEAPFAYKNFEEVMRNQEGLLEVIAHVRPIINIKG